MIFSINFLSKLAVILLIGIFCLSECVLVKKNLSENFQDFKQDLRIVVLPIENLSGTAAPIKDIKESLIKNFKIHGLSIFENEELEKFMARNRVRYTGGIDAATAEAFKKEIGVDAVLITSVELYNETDPSKIALICRLVSTGSNPVILWMDSVGLSGDDLPGILGLGLIEDPHLLMEKATESLAASLRRYLAGNIEMAGVKKSKKIFNPKVFYNIPFLSPDNRYTVAVIPFFNDSTRKNAGEIIMLHFVMQMMKQKNYNIIEPGIIRQELLKMRLIMNVGISLSDADLILSDLNADLMLSGRIMSYDDYIGFFGKAKVDFSAQLLSKMERKIVWRSKSFNEGDDRVFLFDWGKVNTASVMASEMVRIAVESMVKQ